MDWRFGREARNKEQTGSFYISGLLVHADRENDIILMLANY